MTEDLQAFRDRVREKMKDKVVAMQEKLARGEALTPDDRIKVAVLADSPTVVTGFANVCREILGTLYQTGMFDFEIVGINHDGRPHDYPYRIWPAVNGLIPDPKYQEPYGRQKFLDLIGEGRHDIAFVLQDSFIVAGDNFGKYIQETSDTLPVGDQFAFVFYFPIDATPAKRWIDGSALTADLPIVYTQYGYDEVAKLYRVGEHTKLDEAEQAQNKKDEVEILSKLKVVYHGVNTKEYYPLTDDEEVKALRRKFWTEANENKFVFINVNRNQPRKDLYRTLKAFKILLDRRRAKGKDDVYLYMHCNIFDNNMPLLEMAKQIELVEGDEFAYPDPKVFGPSEGFPTRVVNEMYNASDAVVTSTLGEGWGLSVTEGMATKKPVIGPDHTSLSEMLGRTDSGIGERGVLVKTAGAFVQSNDNGRVRPITDEEDLADKMEFVLENRERLQPMVDRAYDWAKSLEWNGQEIFGKWLPIFLSAYKMSLAKRARQIDAHLKEQFKKDGLNRNSQCPVCNTKLKHCPHAP